MDDIKILVSYHKPGVVLQSDLMVPIEVGAASHDEHLGFLQDDEGENISLKNQTLCELTAQYWAWKNLNADYYGFMHYRRHFIFRDHNFNPDAAGAVFFPMIDKGYREDVGLEDDTIRAVVSDYDIVIPPAVDVSCWGTVSNEVQFSSLSNLHARDFDMVCKVVCELYPEYNGAINDFRNGYLCYWFNMFIMRRKLFMDYSSWLFAILEEADRRMDYSEYNAQEKRSLAFMAERLFSIYMMRLLETKPDLKVRHLPITFVINTDHGVNRKSVLYPEPVSQEERFNQMIDSVQKAYGEMKTVGCANALMGKLNNDLKSVAGMKTAEYLFYGAGDNCHLLLKTFKHFGWNMPDQIWDVNARKIKNADGIPVNLPWGDDMPSKDTMVVLTVLNTAVTEEVRDRFLRLGYTNIITYREMMHSVSRALWMRMEESV